MPRLEITHATRLSFSRPIAETVMELHARPLDGLGQRCVSFRLDIDPSSELHSYRDGFGNHVHYFNHLPVHERVTVVAKSVVDTEVDSGPPEVEEFPEDFLQFRSPVLDLPRVRRIAARFSHGPDPESTEAALNMLATWINREFEYMRETTDVFTAIDTVLDLKSGVCQDFAHLFCAVARAMSVPCRYVSGFIPPGGGRTGSGATHAWAEAWVGDQWIGYDPTNPIRAGRHHVRVAVGRDYRDVPPNRGVYLGAASGTIDIEVRVRLLTGTSQRAARG